MPIPEHLLDGCTAKYEQGAISVTSDEDAEDRLVFTIQDAEAAARVLRKLAPPLASALRILARVGKADMISDRLTGNNP